MAVSDGFSGVDGEGFACGKSSISVFKASGNPLKTFSVIS